MRRLLLLFVFLCVSTSIYAKSVFIECKIESPIVTSQERLCFQDINQVERFEVKDEVYVAQYEFFVFADFSDEEALIMAKTKIPSVTNYFRRKLQKCGASFDEDMIRCKALNEVN